MTAPSVHPRQALFGSAARAPALPVCDHYAGTPERMQKSLALQAELGPVFDVTLDNEDGAPVGAEVEQAQLIAQTLTSPANRFGRVGVRLLALEHPLFDDVAHTVLAAQRAPAYVMLPKLNSAAELAQAVARINQAGGANVPLHALVETHGALHEVFALAAHPRIESLSFGLMDFVSAHGGAIPHSAMTATGQFEHPLVRRAKLQIAAACHAFHKTPSHCVVTEFKNLGALTVAADMACRQFGYTRMWSIHPGQVRAIIDSFAPTLAEVDEAICIITAAQAALWAPIRYRQAGEDQLHDRASYRYFWQVIERAQRTSTLGAPNLPAEQRLAWFGPA